MLDLDEGCVARENKVKDWLKTNFNTPWKIFISKLKTILMFCYYLDRGILEESSNLLKVFLHWIHRFRYSTLIVLYALLTMGLEWVPLGGEKSVAGTHVHMYVPMYISHCIWMKMCWYKWRSLTSASMAIIWCAYFYVIILYMCICVHIQVFTHK